MALLRAAMPASGQSAVNDALPEGYKAPRTPDGRPDLQGIWSNAVLTPLERPVNSAGKDLAGARAEENAKTAAEGK
jgi:hypothetical protein